ncbi:MAG: hypothetical protein V4665_00215 [Patescibacteria group bacterium]
MEALREKFLRTYANVPLNLRDSIILVIDKEMTTGTIVKDSISWRVAWIEIDQNTELGNKILKELSILQII